MISLDHMIKLLDNEELSESYIRYICGWREEHQYRHQEIKDIKSLIKSLAINQDKLNGFIFGYTVPQLNKEFDLLKITKSSCLNIELKGEKISLDKIEKQLLQNKHYLKMLNKTNLFLYTYISQENKLFKLNQFNKIEDCQIVELSDVLTALDSESEVIDLDQVFNPKNILVSPLNSTERFLRGDYLLTENQENIKNDIMIYFNKNADSRFAGLTGGPGTGKTLLIYDIALELSKNYRVLMIHCGILCHGHKELDRRIDNIKILSAKDLRLREIKDVDIVIVDEAHRLYTTLLDKVERWVKKAATSCLFSYDAGQTLSTSEKWRNTSSMIDALCVNHAFKLTNKIRTNKELALFITCLRDLSKYREEYTFPNVRILYEPDKNNAMKTVMKLKREGYTYISYTSSFYNKDLDFQNDEYNTHNVIGQEFDAVCMLVGDHFEYTVEGTLKGRQHPNPDYLFGQLLYQGLTRVRSKIALIIMSESILQKVLPLMKNN